jgi:uncharacterized protein YxeA
MKKVKVMLSMIAVLASVGGALAFKAHNMYSGGNVYIKATPGATKCALRVTTLTSTNIGGFIIGDATFPVAGDCAPAIMVKGIQ